MVKKKIIIFRTDLMGDFVMSTALIQKVKNKFPDSNITIVCSNKNYKLVKLYNIFDTIIIFDKKIVFRIKNGNFEYRSVFYLITTL